MSDRPWRWHQQPSTRPTWSRTLTYMKMGLVVYLTAGFAGCTPMPTATYITPPTPVKSYELRLANHLQSIGATMYGTYWCPYCANQKRLFQNAANHLPYVECDPAGQNSQSQLCEAKRIQGYPTWEIDGKLYPGQRSLRDLANLSGYDPPVHSD